MKPNKPPLMRLFIINVRPMIGGNNFFPADTAEECPYSKEHFNEVAKLLKKRFKHNSPLVFIPTGEATLYFSIQQWSKEYPCSRKDTPNFGLRQLPKDKREFRETLERILNNSTKTVPVVLFSHYGPKGVKRILRLLGSRKKFNSKEYKTIFQTNVNLKRHEGR